VLELEAEASIDVEEIIFGFAVVSTNGTAVLGTNSLLRSHGCVSLRRGQRRRIRWQVPNVFSDGRYTVDIVILDRSGLTTYDYWKESASFTAVKEEKTPFPVTPEMSFAIVDEAGRLPAGDTSA